MNDCKMCTDYGYKINRDGYTLCKQHYKEVEGLYEHIAEKENKDEC